MKRRSAPRALLRALFVAVLAFVSAASADLAPLELPGDAKGSITDARYAHPGKMPERLWIAGRADRDRQDLKPGQQGDAAILAAAPSAAAPEVSPALAPISATGRRGIVFDRPRARAPPFLSA